MLNLRRNICVALSSACLMLIGCGDDGNTKVDAPKADTSSIDMPGGCVCDAVGDFPMQGALLNAAVATGAEVITRAARHPGCPGPDNLP
jgi:hypothetical protein